jgi:hypothetical protein
MNRCRDPDHPHCTVWLLPGDGACAHGHPQPACIDEPQNPPAIVQDLIRPPRSGPIRPRPALPATAAAARPHLHISGFDPRAAGGRQAIRLELRDMPADSAPQLAMQLQSALLPGGAARPAFTRTLHGDWLPLFVEFSSRGLEHGQYRIEVALCSAPDDAAPRRWVSTLVILVPRPDATLTDIHQAFLSTHKNVRVVADDASIARVNARPAGGPVDIDITARNASIAHVNLEEPAGKVDLGYPSIAWDEDLIEIDAPEAVEPHPWPTLDACLVNAEPSSGMPRQVRLFARTQHVLGRFEAVSPEADVLLAHVGSAGPEPGGLTRRLSGRHAIVRRGRCGFEIEDVSRYGMLLDGVWPGKHTPVSLRHGMRIELTGSIKGVVVLAVTALLPNGVVLHRVDAGAQAECFCLLEAECDLGDLLVPQGLPVPPLFHRDGGFWHRDPATGQASALTPATVLERLSGFGCGVRFATSPYPDIWTKRECARDRRRDCGETPLPQHR